MLGRFGRVSLLPPVEHAMLGRARRGATSRATEALHHLHWGAPRSHIWELLRPRRVLVGQHQNLSIPGQSELWERPGADLPRKVRNISLSSASKGPRDD